MRQCSICHTFNGHTFNGHTFDGHTFNGYTFNGHVARIAFLNEKSVENVKFDSQCGENAPNT